MGIKRIGDKIGKGVRKKEIKLYLSGPSGGTALKNEANG